MGCLLRLQLRLQYAKRRAPQPRSCASTEPACLILPCIAEFTSKNTQVDEAQCSLPHHPGRPVSYSCLRRLALPARWQCAHPDPWVAEKHLSSFSTQGWRVRCSVTGLWSVTSQVHI